MSQLPVLRTFGTAYIAAEDGSPMTGAAAQRRLLALLALLAAAGPGGMSRDRVLGILWPDGDPERARRTLAQALYHARKVLNAEELFLGTTDLRLNPSCISTDLWLFDAAVDAGELATAATYYQGPFLDGFFLSGSTEFAQWLAAEQMRRAQRGAGVLRKLVAAAGKGGDVQQALQWHRQLVAIDPLDAVTTVGYMTALAEAGDRAAALQHARVYETLLRDQLDIAPDPAVVALVDRLRREPVAVPLTKPASVPASSAPLAISGGHGTPAPSSIAPISIVENKTPAEPEPHADIPVVPRSVLRTLWRPKRVALGAGLVVLMAVSFWIGLVLPRTKAAALIPRQPIVVAPFRVTADPSLAYLREGIVELLSTRLADGSTIRSVDPGPVLRAWRMAGFTRTSDTPRNEIARVATTLGASQVVVGSVVGNANSIVITASLLAAPAGDVVADVVVEGSADSLTTLIDRVAIGLLATAAGENDRLEKHTTLSLPALRAFLAGQQAYRRDDYLLAMQHYEDALATDSSFALAALQLALAADRVNDAEQHDWALARAWAARTELSNRDQAHLMAFAGPRYPAPSPEDEQIAAWERAVTLAPDRAEVLYELGERYFYYGAVVGMTDAPTRAAAAFRRALVLDPRHVASRRLLTLVAARTGDTLTLARLATPKALRDSMGRLAPFMRWRTALVRHDQQALRAVRAQFPTLDRANLRMIAMASQFDAVGTDDGARAVRMLRARSVTRATDQLDALLAAHSIALNAGEPLVALGITDQLQDAQPGSRAHLRLRVLDALYGNGDRNAAVSAVAELERSAIDTALSTDPAQAADACVLGQWYLASNDSRSIDPIIRGLRAAPLPGAPGATPVAIGANPLTCAALLEAMTAVQSHRSSALRRVRDIDALMLSGPAVGDAGTYAHLIVSRLYEQLGEHELALDAIRRHPYMTGWPRYLAAARREESRLAAIVDKNRLLDSSNHSSRPFVKPTV